MTGGATLWQPPRAEEAPARFAERESALLALVADVGRTYASAALASSLSVEDLVIAHAIATTGSRIEVFVIDTGRLHPETLDLVRATEERFGRPVAVIRPDVRAVTDHVAQHGAFGFYDSVEVRKACCHLRKVEPLQRALVGRDAWLTGQRRAHGPERARLAIEERDAERAIAKFNPLAAWDDASVWHYAYRYRLPTNPLHKRGFASIGCEPCTRSIRADEDMRAGRWWWESAHTKECGLHVGTPRAAVHEGTR